MFLEIVAGPHQGTRYEIDRHRLFMVGRDVDVQMPLVEDNHFSRWHFLLEVNPPLCLLQDLDSRNGTFVNGQRVSRCLLKDGDVISGGRTRIKLSIQPGVGTAVPDITSREPAGPIGAKRPKGNLLSSETSAFDTMPDLPEISGYTIDRLLGQGSMGMVYLARRKPKDKQYAIKTVLPEAALSDRMMNLFLREISILSQLRHKRIVRFHEMGAAEGLFYFVMDYVSTIKVREFLQPFSDRVRIKACVALILQVLEALEYAHARGYVHRDVKPPNVLVGWKGSKLRAKVADFGLAKNFESAGYSGMTFDGDLIGTCAFMAPEQVCNSRDAKPAADLYSVTATLYWFLTGQFPHDFSQGGNPIKVILEHEPVPIQEREPAVTDDLAKIIHTGLARNPHDRFASAHVYRKALESFSALKKHKEPHV